MGLANDVLIGLEAGTSRVRAVAFASDGQELGQAAAETPVHHVAGGGVEQDLGDAWQAAASALRALAGRVPGLAARTVALAITGQGGGVWLIDDDGDPVAPARLPEDRRAAPLVERWRRLGIGSELREITGSAIASSLPSAQLADIAERCPALLDRAATALQGKDWLYFCCTQERATDPASAATAFGDFRTGAYDLRVLERLRLPEIARLLPEIVDGTREHGALTRPAAAATGLSAGTPVVLAPVGLIAGALAAGLAEPDVRLGCSVLGGGGVHIRVDRAAPKLAGGVGAILPFAGLWFKTAPGPAQVVAGWLVGLAAQLLADAGLIGIGRAELIAVLEQKAAAAAPATLRLHPGAPEADHGGAPAGFLGISGRTTFYDLLRAVYEGEGIAARACYEALGGGLDEIRVTGEGAASALARQVLAACVDVPLRVLERAAPAAAGAALIAAVALGRYCNLVEASRDWAGPHLRAPEPVDRDLRRTYAERLADLPAASRDRRAAGA